jgi:aldehyde oxidoreductase
VAGCGKGECRACSLIMDGKVIRACITKIKRVPDEAQIITIKIKYILIYGNFDII